MQEYNQHFSFYLCIYLFLFLLQILVHSYTVILMFGTCDSILRVLLRKKKYIYINKKNNLVYIYWTQYSNGWGR